MCHIMSGADKTERKRKCTKGRANCNSRSTGHPSQPNMIHYWQGENNSEYLIMGITLLMLNTNVMFLSWSSQMWKKINIICMITSSLKLKLVLAKQDGL